MARMTVDEKIGQLNLPTSGDITTGAANSSDVAKNIEEGKVGGLFNIKSVERLKKRKGSLKSRLKNPIALGWT
jgi:beta-glucosidase